MAGCAYFGLAAASYMHFPLLASHMGATLATTGIVASLLGGMTKFHEKNVVNCIEFVNDSSEHQGKLKLNVSTGPFTS
jgi:hypothetical protein